MKKKSKSHFYLHELNDLWLDGKLYGKSRFWSSFLVILNWIHMEWHWKCMWRLQKCPWKSHWKCLLFFWNPVFTMIQFHPYHLSPFRMKTDTEPVVAGSHRHSYIDESLNTFMPKQNGRRFADDTFKRIFLNENVRISIKISLKFVPKGPINNIPALVQIMTWRRSGDKPLSKPMMASLLTHICVTRSQWVNLPVNVSW